MEEWNEYGEIKENLGAGSAADPLVPTPSAPSTPSKPPNSASAASGSTMLAATPPRSVQKPTMESHLTTAMRKAGLEAAKKAVDVKPQSRALGESKGSKDMDQDGVEKGANKSTTTELKPRVELKTSKGGESQIIASAEESGSEEEDDEVDEEKVEEKADSELKTLPIRPKPRNLQEAGEGDDEEGGEDEGGDGDEEQDEEGADSRSQKLPTSEPTSKGKTSQVGEDDDEEEEEEEGDEEEDEEEGDEEDEEGNGDAGRKKLPISKPLVKAGKVDEDEDEEDEEDDEDDDEKDEQNETPSTIQTAAPPPPPKPKTGEKDPPKFKTGGPLLDHRKLNQAKSSASKK